MGEQRAKALDPHIYWGVPDQPEQTAERSYIAAILCLVLSLSALRFALERARDFQALGAVAYYPTSVKVRTLVVSVILSLMAALFALGAAEAFTQRTLKWLPRVTRAVALLILLFVVALGAANAFYYHFDAPGKWNDLLDDQLAVLGLLTGCSLALLVGPVIAVWRWPRLVDNVWLERVVNFAFPLSAFLSSVIFWAQREEMPAWFTLPYLFNAVILGLVGLNALRTGQSSFEIMRSLFVLDPSEGTAAVHWERWLSSRLDEDEQKALTRHLERKYPVPIRRRLTGAAILASSIWLILNMASAVVEWFVQNFLDALVK